MATAVVMPKAGPAALNRLSRTCAEPSMMTVRASSAGLMLGPVLAFVVLFALLQCAFFGDFTIGGSSDALAAIYRTEDAVSLMGAAVVGLAWCVAAFGSKLGRRTRLLIPVGVAALCVLGGLAAEYALRCVPADIDPSGGHVAGEVRYGRVFWEPLALCAAACALAVVVAPPARRKTKAVVH